MWLIELLLLLGLLGLGAALLLVLLGPLILIGLAVGGLALIGLIIGLVGGVIGLVFGLLGGPSFLGVGALLIGGALALFYLAKRRGYIEIKPRPRSSRKLSQVQACPRCGALIEPGRALCPHCRLELPKAVRSTRE